MSSELTLIPFSLAAELEYAASKHCMPSPHHSTSSQRSSPWPGLLVHKDTRQNTSHESFGVPDKCFFQRKDKVGNLMKGRAGEMGGRRGKGE